MNPSQLAETTMNPQTRSLLQVSQIDDDDYAIFDTLIGDGRTGTIIFLAFFMYV